MNLPATIIERLTPNNYSELTLGLSMELQIETLEQEPDFCEEFIKTSLDNLGLSLSGHLPEKSFRFSAEKFIEWCKKNHLSVRNGYKDTVYIITTLNTFFWIEKLSNKQRELYLNAIERALTIFDMKNRAYYPTHPNQLKKIKHATEPFIEYIYLEDKLLLVWDHQNNKTLQTEN